MGSELEALKAISLELAETSRILRSVLARKLGLRTDPNGDFFDDDAPLPNEPQGVTQ